MRKYLCPSRQAEQASESSLCLLKNFTLGLQRKYEWVMGSTQGNPVGVEFSNRSGDQWAVILPEMSNPEDGAYRIQYFRASGFTSHGTYKTVELAAEEMCCSYHLKALGMLDKLNRTTMWKQGNELNSLIYKVNVGQLSWSEFCDIQKELMRESGQNFESYSDDELVILLENKNYPLSRRLSAKIESIKRMEAPLRNSARERMHAYVKNRLNMLCIGHKRSLTLMF
ncbi:hypothetical protein [Iodobacter fluviatilis]|uniref:Uncharacterized protein n=1 Tax=Iodobacter fluviatilis TaxID=537 RepID=A0A377Q5K9_9NEIS|nr:hypothetical protein [Iodobacter fluviatilis]TCU84583.1 hypothetical protein EV682_109108 [Iodobacter fluviatilis]STQ90048.1 Uncharacterised protein [Iodobacter fluviatilis]